MITTKIFQIDKFLKRMDYIEDDIKAKNKSADNSLERLFVKVEKDMLERIRNAIEESYIEY